MRLKCFDRSVSRFFRAALQHLIKKLILNVCTWLLQAEALLPDGPGCEVGMALVLDHSRPGDTDMVTVLHQLLHLPRQTIILQGIEIHYLIFLNPLNSFVLFFVDFYNYRKKLNFSSFYNFAKTQNDEVFDDFFIFYFAIQNRYVFLVKNIVLSSLKYIFLFITKTAKLKIRVKFIKDKNYFINNFYL